MSTTNHTTALPASFAEIGFIEYLQCDPRPTFILESGNGKHDPSSPHRLVFSNKALQDDTLLSTSINTLLTPPPTPTDTGPPSAEFRSWLLDTSSPQQHCSFDGLLWSSTCLHQQWIIVSGCRQSFSRSRYPFDEVLAANHDSSTTVERPDVGLVPVHRKASPSPIDSRPLSSTTSPSRNLDILVKSLGVNPTPHNLMVIGFDWAKTPVGSIQTWPPMLRQLVPYLLNGLQPGVITWGAERTMIYNEAYSLMIKGLHPQGLGSSAKILFGNFWEDQMEPKWQAVESHGPARHENTKIYMDRSGFLEETYFTYSLTPLWDSHGKSCGVDNRSFEVTRQVVVEARMLSLLKISESVATATSLEDFWQGLVSAMASNSADFPLFALYSLQFPAASSNGTDTEPSTMKSHETWIMRGSAGFPHGHPTIPETLEVGSAESFAPAFRATSGSSSPLVFSEGDGVMHEDLLQGLDTPDLRLRCHQVVVCPLRSSSRSVMGFLALGINPSRPYDDEYKTFVQLLSRQIETSISPVLSLLNEKMQSQLKARKSEHEQQLLTTELEKQTLEARRSELRFLRFAEQAPLGVYILGADGGVKYANDAWMKLAGIDPDYKGTHGWLMNVHPDDKEKVEEQWQRLVDGHTQTDFEWRAVKKLPDREPEVIHLRASSFPELGADGTMKTVTGVLMDLSLERAQEYAQNARLKDALEAKQAQEYFMDMVSHEIRNPLHAILQLAEETASLLEEVKPTTATQVKDPLSVRACIDNVHTVMYCGHHQKQILDDVLTLSKLNSNMLTLSLTDVTPTSVVSKVLKFFDSDIRLSNIEICLQEEDLPPTTQYPNVLMDSGRVLQILFNLVGNSIKFMKDRPIRKLTLTIKLTSTKPDGGGLRFLLSGKHYADPTAGKNKSVYVYYSVQDTGPGLTVEEMDVLFERFKQVSPKTHTQYGGSGLGLFISRELAERHGGAIGLASVVDQGSIFAFYVKCAVAEHSTNMVNAGDQVTAIPQTQMANPTTSDRPRILSRQIPSSSANDTTILIVEDNIVNQKILDRQLKRLGYQTRTANHGSEALIVLKASTWWHESSRESTNLSVVLCDLEMPVMDGMTFIREIRAMQWNKLLSLNIPVVALTGNARIEQIDAAKEAGFDDVVSKPYSMQILIAKIEAMILRK